MSEGAPVLQLDQITRAFAGGAGPLEVLKGASLIIQPGELVALVGPSGAGKSTLLQIAGLLEAPTGGRVIIAGTDCTGQADRERTAMRRDLIGFVYQFHHLLPEFTALENVMMPQRIQGTGAGPARDRARALLDQLGLGARLDHRPSTLSGGEQQRVAIARALANRPRLLLADEPTGNLDPETSDQVFDALLHVARHDGVGALIATHNPDLARRMDRVVTMKGGVLV